MLKSNLPRDSRADSNRRGRPKSVAFHVSFYIATAMPKKLTTRNTKWVILTHKFYRRTKLF